MGLVAHPHVGSSRTRDQTRVPCIGRWILNDWTTREVPPHKSFVVKLSGGGGWWLKEHQTKALYDPYVLFSVPPWEPSMAAHRKCAARFQGEITEFGSQIPPWDISIWVSPWWWDTSRGSLEKNAVLGGSEGWQPAGWKKEGLLWAGR